MNVECAKCGERIIGEIVRDPEQVSWLGMARAETFCSTECLERASESYWMGVWS